jgi:hypothetical protein
MAFVSSELFCGCNYDKILAVSHKYRALTWGNVNFAVVGIVNVDICSDIKDEILTVVTGVNIVLLAFYRVNFFNFKRAILVLETIVVRIVLLFDSFWL